MIILAVPSVPSSGASASNTSVPAAGSYASSELQAAAASLQSGSGPSGSGSLSCSSVLFLIASCAPSIAPSLSPLQPASSADPDWTKLGAASPQGRLFAGMAYDSADGYVVLFGGLNVSSQLGAPLSDTWKFSGGVWTEIKPATSPSARILQAMTYDAADGYIVLFGGFAPATTSGGPPKSLADTWKFSNGSWTNITGTKGPSPRGAASLAYDASPSDGYVVLFGGLPVFPNGGPIGTTFGDTWRFSGGTWTNITTIPGPPARAGGSMAYDTMDGYTLLYGGLSQTGVLSDGWKFTGGSWTSILSSGNPGPRVLESMAYDSAAGDNYVVLFGGASAVGAGGSGLTNVRSDTWKFSGGSWTNITSTVDPPAQFGAVITYDSSQGDGYLLFFGADSASWKFSAGTWTPAVPSSIPGPSPRLGASMAYDAADGYVVLFGGTSNASSNSAVFHDTWEFHAGSWTNITTGSGPPPTAYAPMTYDAADGYVLLLDAQTWEFRGRIWTIIPESTSPGFRFGGSIIYDSADGYVVLFGGCCRPNSIQPFSDTWKFSGGVWTNITATTGPSPRVFCSMAYDALDGYGVLFGGVSHSISSFPFSGTLSDTWKFSGGSWTNITTTTGPLARTLSTMAFDIADGYTLLFGGVNGVTGFLGDTWTFIGGAWTTIPTAISPSARSNGSMTYDEADHYVVLFGGTSSAVGLGDTWTWSQQRPTTTSLFCFPNTVAVGQSAGCIVFVADTSGAGATTPSGIVGFSVTGVTGTFSTQTCTLFASGACGVNFSASTTGVATITATYRGDATHGSSSATATLTVANLDPTAMLPLSGIPCAPLISVVNQPVTCTVWVEDTSSTGATPPTGPVNLPIQSATGSSHATCTLSPVNSTTSTCSGVGVAFQCPGGCTQQTWYNGDLNHDGSGSDAGVFYVTARTTSTNAVCVPAPTPLGSATTCTVTVTDTDVPNRLTPTGTVDVTVTSGPGTITGAPCALIASSAIGSATCQVTYRPTGGVVNTRTDILNATYDGDGTHFRSTSNYNIDITQSPTTSSLFCLPHTVAVGQTAGCIAFVSDTSGAGGTTPSGTVNFSVAGVTGSFPYHQSCPLVVLSSTVSGCPLSTFTANSTGTATITVSYGGDSSHAGSSATFTLTVANLHPTSMPPVQCTTTSLNQPVTCTAYVKDTSTTGATAPTGPVDLPFPGTFFNEATCTLVPVNSTTASCTDTGVFQAPTFISWYNGDATHDGTFTGTVTVTSRSTSASLLCLPNTVAVSQSVTCFVKVIDSAGGGSITPTGTVDFSVAGVTGTFSPNSCTLGGGVSVGAACYVIDAFSSTTTGSATLAATYLGDSTHSGSSATTVVIIANLHPTFMPQVVCTPTTVFVGQPITCTAYVKDAASTGASPPTGEVLLPVFNETGSGGFGSVTCTLTSINATWSSCSGVGVRHGTCPGPCPKPSWYNGDSTHDGAESLNAPIIVNSRPTTTTVACTPSAIVAGGSTSCTATVTDTSTAGPARTPVGTVAFSQTGITSGASFTGNPCILVPGATGTATCSVTFTSSTSGSASISASYTSTYDDHAGSSTTLSATVTINGGLSVNTPTVSFSTIDSGQGSVLFGSFTGGTAPYSCQWLEKVPGAGSYSNLGGAVSCGPPQTNSATGVLTTAGTWSFELQVTDSSATPVTVTSSPVMITVNPVFVVNTPTASPSTVTSGGSSSLSTTFTGGTGPYGPCQWLVEAPGATVFSSFGSVASCTSPATISTAALSTPGAWTFEFQVADSSGPGNVVISSPVTVTVTNAGDFSIRATSATALGAGVPATSTITVTAIGAFTGKVDLTDIVPAGLICDPITPLSVTLTTSPQTASVSCSASIAGNGYSLTIVGTSGALVHSTTAGFVAIDFGLTASSPASVPTGTQATSSIAVFASNGFQGTISLTDLIPSGLTCNAISPPSIVLGGVLGEDHASLSCTSNTPGTYTVTITGNSSGMPHHSTTATFTFSGLSATDFTLTVTPPSATIASASSKYCHGSDEHGHPLCDDEASFNVTVVGLNGFTGNVTLTVSASPSISTELDAATISGTGSTTLRVGEAPSGTYTVTVRATSGSLLHSTNVLVTVRPPAKLKCGSGDSDDCGIESDAPLSNTNFSGHTIHFTMTGEAGTSAVANVTIARSAVPDINRVRVYVDRNQLSSGDLTITSDANSYYVFFKVTFHSNVDVDIDLNPASTILGLDPAVFYSLAGVVATVLVGIGALALSRRRRKP